MKCNPFIIGCAFLAIVLTACTRDDGIPVDTSISLDQPDLFARFLNPVAALPAGDYAVVAATDTAGLSGSFVLTITFDDGEKQVFNGSWTSSGGQDETSASNPSFNFTQFKAGGINISLESSVDTYLYLLHSPSGTIVAENNDDSVSTTNSLVKKDASRIDSEEYAIAYYSAIDPTNAKTTLEDWKVANGYYAAEAAGDIINARFRDTKDLGYGRGMRVWTNATDGSVYAFVENFQVAVIPGQEYSSLNLDALIDDQRQYHFGTNAIEFSTYPYGPGEPSDIGSMTRFTKFYSFDASGADKTPGTQDHVNETRINQVNLDGRGNKSMPGACVYCHGGTLKPLLADGTFRDNSKDGTTGNGLKGDTNAKMQLIEVNSLEFWPETPFTKAEQEVFLKQINMSVYCTYPNPNDVVTPGYCDVQPSDPTPVATVFGGVWSASFAREMAEGWYDADPTTDAGGDGVPDFDSPTFMADFVPVGWRPDVGTGNPPAGADLLFLKAVGPNCFICHSRRGVDLDATDTDNEHIDFSTYEKFIGDAELIKEYVYDSGVMPLSLRGYVDFWGNDNDAPVIMASFLNGALATDNQIILNGAGGVDQPGAPIADAGPDRSTSSPSRLFGSNSQFVSKFNWSVISTPVGGESAVLTDEGTSSPMLTVPIDGDYVIQLTASNGARSDTDTVTVKINSALTVDPKDLVFSDVEAILDADCLSCHSIGGISSVPGIPVIWEAIQPLGGTTRYQEVLTRVDFANPTKSLILTKPSGNHHFGGLRTGFEVGNPSNRQHYDTILNWILEGAREN